MKHPAPFFLVSCVLAAATAMASDRPPDLGLVVHGGHYAVSGRSFDDLGALGEAIEAMKPHSIRIVACGPGSTHALMAAAHRLRAWPLDLQVHAEHDAACRTDDPAADRYWRSIAP